MPGFWPNEQDKVYLLMPSHALAQVTLLYSPKHHTYSEVVPDSLILLIVHCEVGRCPV
jgi:hypothetical protein